MALTGGALWKPMAVLMISGLALASILTLFFVPAGYFLLFRFGAVSGQAGRKKRPLQHPKPTITTDPPSSQERA